MLYMLEEQTLDSCVIVDKCLVIDIIDLINETWITGIALEYLTMKF